MPFEPFRFVHASGLKLDHHLAGTGPVEEGIQSVIEQATLEAFERVLKTAIDEEAAFVLLCGDSFDHRDRSLRAQAALVDGFQQLAERNIDVFVQPGLSDPAEAWHAISHLPENVTIFHGEASAAPVAVRRGGVIATVSSASVAGNGSAVSPSRIAGGTGQPFHIVLQYAPSSEPDLAQSADEASFQEALKRLDHPSRSWEQWTGCPADYIALGGGPRETTTLNRGIAHDPGTSQGLSPGETGARGCTLVEVDGERTVHCRFLPTAPVRWERAETQIDENTQWEALLEALRQPLRAEPPHVAERVRLMQWLIRGTGPLFAELHEESFRSGLTEALNAQDFLGGAVSVCHRFRLHLPEGDPPGADPHSMAGEYFDAVRDDLPVTQEFFSECLAAAGLENAAHRGRLESLLGELDPRAVRAHAWQLGAKWFDDHSEAEGW